MTKDGQRARTKKAGGNAALCACAFEHGRDSLIDLRLLRPFGTNMMSSSKRKESRCRSVQSWGLRKSC